MRRHTGFLVERLVTSIGVQTLLARSVTIEPAYDLASGEGKSREMVVKDAEAGSRLSRGWWNGNDVSMSPAHRR